MKRTILQLFLLSSCGICACMGETIDWDKIQFWSGTGENKAALVIQFEKNMPDNPGAIVWGFRWSEGENPSGEDMARAIAAGSSDLTLFTQFTGDMGNTVCGFGYSRSRETLLNNLIYDYEGASADDRISFGFENANTGMNQTYAPGAEAVSMIYESIDNAKESHIIDHPLNQREFGYACYDYDWWKLSSDLVSSECFWNAGWYDGFWSYWIGDEKIENLGYSGLGMSSVKLSDGDVNGWRYLNIDGNSGASIQASRQRSSETGDWLPLNYTHFSTPSAISDISLEEGTATKEIYTLGGMRVENIASPGIYIVKEGNIIYKVII